MKLRTALPLAIVLPVTLAPALAWGASPPSVTARLEYQRGPGTKACAAEAGLRLEVARRSGYDPFTADARARLVVTATWKGRQIIGTLQFYDDKSAPGWSKVLPVRANDCATFIAAMGPRSNTSLLPLQLFPPQLLPWSPRAWSLRPRARIPQADEPDLASVRVRCGAWVRHCASRRSWLVC